MKSQIPWAARGRGEWNFRRSTLRVAGAEHRPIRSAGHGGRIAAAIINPDWVARPPIIY
jgi:hypothetical protein